MKTKGHLGIAVLFCRYIVVAKHHSLFSYHMLKSTGLKVKHRKIHFKLRKCDMEMQET